MTGHKNWRPIVNDGNEVVRIDHHNAAVLVKYLSSKRWPERGSSHLQDGNWRSHMEIEVLDLFSSNSVIPKIGLDIGSMW